MIDLIIVVICLAINAFFSAYEMAFVTITKDEIDELDERGSILKKILFFKKKPERTLSVIQIGISLVGAIAAAVGGTGAVESLEPYIVKTYGLSPGVAQAIAVTLVILPLTYFSVVFGELVPKTIALKHPLKVLTLGTRALSLIDRGLSPIVTFLEVSTNYLLRLIGLDTKVIEDESMGESIDIGNLPAFHQKFVQNLVNLKSQKVRKSMIPWGQVIYMNFGDSEEEVRTKMATTPHSRFPVIDDDVLVGILNVKELPDLLRVNHLPWQSILRPAVLVQSSQKVLEAFLKMQEKHSHIAVVEEDGKFVGIITIESVLEEVVGDIYDNSDQSKISKILSQRSKIRMKS